MLTIPKFVVDTVIKKDADIVILVEFYIGINFDYLREQFEETYNVFISAFAYEHNQVLIALKKTKFKENEIINIKVSSLLNKNIPEYLQIDIQKNKQCFSIIGARAKANTKEKRAKQFKYIDSQLASLEKAICIGDFNLTCGYCQEKLTHGEVYGPRILGKERWSFVHKNGDKVGIDLIVLKNIKIKKDVEDKQSIQGNYKMYAKYIWDFVCKENGYSGFSPSDYLSGLLGQPDHAILIGKFIVA